MQNPRQYYSYLFLCRGSNFVLVLLLLLMSVGGSKESVWEQECEWQNPENELFYDLSPLTKSSPPYYISNGPNSDIFNINICDVVTDGCEELTTPVCQYIDTHYVSMGNITSQRFLPLTPNS
jgi:hypothetical protein